jgi:hypothetical protein
MQPSRLLALGAGVCMTLALVATAVAVTAVVRESSLGRSNRALAKQLSVVQATADQAVASQTSSDASASKVSTRLLMDRVDIDDLVLQVKALEKRVDNGGVTSAQQAATQSNAAITSNQVRQLSSRLDQICTYLRAVDDPSTYPMLLC